MGGCQNCGPFLDPYYNTAPNIQGTQKGTIILTTTHMFGLRVGAGGYLRLSICHGTKRKTLNPQERVLLDHFPGHAKNLVLERGLRCSCKV